MSRPQSRLRTLALAPVGLGLALVLAGCNGGGTTNPPVGAATTAPATAPSDAPQPDATSGARQGGGVSGTIAYVSGELMQVQDTSMQTAVAWTDSTTFSAETSGTLADVVNGVCVVATNVGSFTAGSSTAAPTAEPSASGAVTRVAITDPVDGACQLGAFVGGGGGFTGRTPGELPSGMPTGGAQDGQGGQFPGGFPTDLPSGFPTDLPSGGFGNGTRMVGARTAGLVTGVSGSTITVQTTAQDGTTSSSTITVDGSTTYTKTVTADASAVVVGQCALAVGPSDSSGKVTATSITVSAPVDGSCSSFGTARAGTGLTGSRGGSGTGGNGGFGYRNRGGTGGAGNGGSTGTQGGSNA